MNRKLFALSLLIALTAVIGLSLVAAQDAPATSAPSWEYAILAFNANPRLFLVAMDDEAAAGEFNTAFFQLPEDKGVVHAMNLLGLEGWEFVSERASSEVITLYTFKRPVG